MSDADDLWKTIPVPRKTRKTNPLSCCRLLFIFSWSGYSDLFRLFLIMYSASPPFANQVVFGFQPALPTASGIPQLHLPSWAWWESATPHYLCWEKFTKSQAIVYLGRGCFYRSGTVHRAWQHQSCRHQPPCTVRHISRSTKENNYNLLEMIGR